MRSQAFLFVKLGGTGLRSAVQHSSMAFIASVGQTSSIVDTLLATISRRSSDRAFLLLQRHSGNAAYTSAKLLPSNYTQQGKGNPPEWQGDGKKEAPKRGPGKKKKGDLF